MKGRAFDLASFYGNVRAIPKERSALRQALVRGLKDYFEEIYGYDRYGAETIFLLRDRMVEPYVYGFALLRILHDRRISVETKARAAQQALEMVEYGSQDGIPFGLFAALHFLADRRLLTPTDLRYGLIVTAGEAPPFRAVEKAASIHFFRLLIMNEGLPSAERMFWGHSLAARHGDHSGAPDLINSLLGHHDFSLELRIELCQAWVNFRQPRLPVPTPVPDDDPRSKFVSEHLPFWVAHSPSWPSSRMLHLGIIWLSRLSADPSEPARRFIAYHGSYAEQAHAAVAEVISEAHVKMGGPVVKELIEQGVTISGSAATRRRFYRLGAELFGEEYLARASQDTAGSVRQWAARQRQQVT